jgi:concanavalin A-like lectin/glucanase superfamily protein
MSPTLIVMIPLVLLGLVAALCFVGCVLQTGGIEVSAGPYQDLIRGEKTLGSCWPLNDQSETPTAVDGTPAQDVGPNKIQTGTYSAPTVGSVKLQQAGIVTGDHLNTKSPCAQFSGGSMTVPWDARLNPNTSFSIEAWAQAEWKLSDPGVPRIVVASDDLNGLTGYQLHATVENHWAAVVGTGSQFVPARPAATDPPTVKPGEPTHLVATFNATTGVLSLFVNGTLSAQAPAIAAPQGFLPAINPTPFTIGTGGISPQFPFTGEIQDVAFYNAALDPGTIAQHFNVGSAP